MKHFVTATSLSLLLGAGAMAALPAHALDTYATEQSGDIYASNLIGRDIYATEKDWDGLQNNGNVRDDAEKEWEDIGEVEDIILGSNGEVRAVIIGVGGFLDIGDKDVAVPMSQIKMVREDGDDDRFLVVKASKATLEGLPAYTRQTERKNAKAVNQNQNKDNTRTAAKTDDDMKSKDSAADRDGYRMVALETVSPSKLQGANLYSEKNEDIGEVDRVLTTSEGKVEKLILDVGGFLGLGEHRISVNPSEVRIKTSKDGDDVRVYINATKEQLEKRPAYKG